MNEQFVTLMAVGDIMLGDDPICIGHGVGSTLKERNYESQFNSVSDIFKQGDIIFGNLECVLSNLDINYKSIKSVQFRGSENCIHSLVDAGFNVISLANNHILEHGLSSLKRTQNLLSKNGIHAVGVSENKDESINPVILKQNGITFGFLAYCLIRDKTAYCSVEDPFDIINDVKEASTKVDNLIVSMHWGNEYIRKPSPQQVELGHAIIDAGANLILGHHPHVLQGVEKYNDGVIVYSMGNFVFDMWQRKMRESMIFSCDFSKEGIQNFDIVPTIIGKDFKPVPLNGIEKEKLKSQITGEFMNLMDEESYIDEVQACRQQYRFDIIKHLAFHFYQFNPLYLFQIIMSSLKK